MLENIIPPRWLLSMKKTFGYSQTITSLIRLIYWILGEFYYSNVFDRRLTLFWIAYNATNTVLYFSHCLSYLFFTADRKFVDVLFFTNAILTGVYLVVVLQLTSYVHREPIFETFEKLDQDCEDMLSNENLAEVEFVRRKPYSKRLLFALLASQLGGMVCYEICTNLYFAVDYTEAKLTDPNSYFYPVYCDRVENMVTFGIVSSSQIIASSPLIIAFMLAPLFVMITVREFYCKFQQICDAIDYHSRVFERFYERSLVDTSDSWGKMQIRSIQEYFFMQNIRNCVQRYEKLLKAISSLKPYMELNMSISICIFMHIEVVLCYLYIFVSDDDGSAMLKIKNANFATIIGTIFFVYCLAGKLFSDMEDMFRECVYNIPWVYLSHSNRKFIHVLLTRAHMKITFKSVKVYPMNMALFLQFYRHVYTIVNVMRHVTITHNG